MPRVEYDGRLLSAEEIAALGEGLIKETEAETVAETEEPETVAPKEAADGTVHWTDGGVVWHESLSCSRLSHKTTVRTGSVEDAMAANKERGCSFCCK